MTDSLYEKQNFNANKKNYFLFNGKNGAILKGAFSLCLEDNEVSFGLNYALIANFVETKHAYVCTDINNQNPETYLNPSEYMIEYDIDDLLIFDFPIDDLEHHFKAYSENISKDKAIELINSKDPNNNIQNDLYLWTKKQKRQR